MKRSSSPFTSIESMRSILYVIAIIKRLRLFHYAAQDSKARSILLISSKMATYFLRDWTFAQRSPGNSNEEFWTLANNLKWFPPFPLSSPSPKRELETCSTTPEGFLPTMVDETFLESEKNHQDNPYKNRSNNPGNVMYAHVTVLSIRSSINPLELGKQSRKWILYRILKRISKHVWALEPIRYQKKKK